MRTMLKAFSRAQWGSGLAYEPVQYRREFWAEMDKDNCAFNDAESSQCVREGDKYHMPRGYC